MQWRTRWARWRASSCIPGSPQGKVVITLEARTQDDVVRTMAGIGDMPGVLSTALVYQHAEADGHSAA